MLIHIPQTIPIDLLSDNQAGKCFKAIIAYLNKHDLPKMDNTTQKMFEPFKQQIDNHFQAMKKPNKIPSFVEVKEWFLQGKQTIADAQAFYDYYSKNELSGGFWTDKNQKKVLSWRKKARNVWFKDYSLKSVQVQETIKSQPKRLVFENGELKEK